MTKWVVADEDEGGLGRVLWTGQAATAVGALRLAFPRVPASKFTGMVDVNHDGSRFEIYSGDGSSTLVIEAV